MNFNGFHALCCTQNGYAQIPWTVPSDSRFTVCIRFLPDAIAIHGKLISFGSSLSIRILDGHMQLDESDLDSASDHVILPRCQNTVAVVCDGKNLSVYCNGALALQQIVPSGFNQITYLRVGEALSGVCVNQVTIFHRVLTRPEIQVSQVKNFSDYYKQIDFTSASVPADITLQQCRIENCVYTLDCRKGGFTMPYAYFPKEYTLSFSVYFLKQKQEELTLFKSPSICIRLYCPGYGSGSPVIKIDFNNKEHSYTPRAMKTEQWMNLTVVFSDSRLTVYCNENPQIDSDYIPSPVTGRIEFGQFEGYLDNCAVISRALTQNEIADYIRQPPNVFAKDMLYLFSFSDKLWQESCHGTELTASGARITLIMGSNASVSTDKSKPAPQSSRTYSDFVNWQIRLLLRLLICWIHEQLGIYPNKGVQMDCDPWKIDVSLHHFIHKEILSMKEAQDILCHYDNITAKKLLALIQAMKLNGTLKKLMDYLYQEDDEQNPVSDILLALLAAAFLAALLASLGKAITGVGPIPKPPKAPQDDSDYDDDDEDDTKKKKTYVSIKQTALKSDLRIEFEHKDISWDNEETAVFFMHGISSAADGLRASVTYKGDSGDFTVYAENKKGQIIPSAQKSVSFKGNAPVHIILDVQPNNFQNKYGKCTETVSWRCESKDGKQSQFLGETTYHFYFLENASCKLWGNTVHIECLELCADCAEYAGNRSENFILDFARYLQQENTQNEYMKAHPSTHTGTLQTYPKTYSKLPTPGQPGFSFDAVSFAKDYRRGSRNISHDDLVYANTVFGYLNGHSHMKVVWLSSNMTCPSQSIGGSIPVYLLLKNIAVDGFSVVKDSLHCVMADSDNKIYDAKLNSYGLCFSDNTERPVTGTDNSLYYRENNYLAGSYCEIISQITVDAWSLDNMSNSSPNSWSSTDLSASSPCVDNIHVTNKLPDRPSVGWVRPMGDGRYEPYGRTYDDPFVWHYIRTRDRHNVPPAFNTVCHSISSHEIDVIIARICTERQVDHLQTLIDALYPVAAPFDDMTADYHRLTLRMMATLQRCLLHGNDYTDVVINHFCRLAANSPANLRLGRGDWNGAIGASFDPESWFYCYHLNDAVMISNHAVDEAREGRQLQQILRARYGDAPIPIDDQHGFYLPSHADGVRIQKMLALGQPINVIVKCIQDPGPAGPVFYPLLYSSGNRFEIHADRDGYIDLPDAVFPGIRIYYRSPDAPDRWTAL